MDRKWWKESVVYQIYPRSFMDSNGDGIGDLKGITMKLPYLKELGIDIIWLCPVYKSPNDDNGYDISDYKDIMDEFGTMKDWEDFLWTVHEQGMKLIMDLVINHTSDVHPWFIQSRSSKDSPYRDYYIWKKGTADREPSNWGACFGGSAWEYAEKTGEYYLHVFSRRQPDLNWNNPKVRNEIYDIIKYWLDKGIDGFRMDAINCISKDPEILERLPEHEPPRWGGLYFMENDKVHTFLREMNQRVLSGYDIVTVGETPGVSVEDGISYTDSERKELNMIFQFELMDLDYGPEGKWDTVQWKLKDLKSVITKWQTGLMDKGWNSLFLNNHDQPRMVSRFGNDGLFRVQSAKLLATLIHTLKGTPFIYQGEEIGMTNVAFDSIDKYRDIETLNYYRSQVNEKSRDYREVLGAVHSKSRDNARTPMQWNSSKNAGFTEAVPWIDVNPNYKDINVEQASKDTESILNLYKKLIELRKKYPVIVYGDYTEVDDDSESIFAYTRCLDGKVLLVVLNFSDREAEFRLPGSIDLGGFEELLCNYNGECSSKDGTIVLRPYEAKVYLKLDY